MRNLNTGISQWMNLVVSIYSPMWVTSNVTTLINHWLALKFPIFIIIVFLKNILCGGKLGGFKEFKKTMRYTWTLFISSSWTELELI